MQRCILAVVILAGTTACGGRADESPLAEIAKAPMQPGVGLGELKLKQTTIGAFTKKYDATQSVVTPEQDGAKIDFMKEGLSFLFRGNPECAAQLLERMRTSQDTDINKFLVDQPACETMLLETIAAYIPEMGEPLYEGETVEGVGLNAARAMAERAYQATQNAVNAMETGEALPEQEVAPPNELHQPGIRIYLGKEPATATYDARALQALHKFYAQ